MDNILNLVNMRTQKMKAALLHSENISRIKYLYIADEFHNDIIYEVSNINFFTNEISLIKSAKKRTLIPENELFMFDELMNYKINIQN